MGRKSQRNEKHKRLTRRADEQHRMKNSHDHNLSSIACAALRRGLLFALLWWVLTEGHGDQWGVGLAGVTLAVTANLILWPPGQTRFYFPGLLAFAGFFLLQSVKAGIQVALIALHPRLNLTPTLLRLPLTLPPGLARVLLVNTMNLLPGTICLRIEQDVLLLHTLNEHWPVAQGVRIVEKRIACMLGIPG
ncbi:MAG: Na+/H+ antiporter subunit E [Desulfurivibrionaceae bacterium]|jgi:multicomponent Na+:H+ antiporter subunit E|nr:Na+/H+ antiporter subunit E [Desulfobulbaceae bacterium]MDP2002304.1 Na+/H+ antiporter subunit E [Desulfurivibrionaceae bacterium]MDP2757518.1 Na+/H+ antiporter subunit E [Desulfurivibrionaceae bacterium]PKN22909.1 MAG: cation transporter [Deltaproteobacteria bacterium HGW-Deltaproteobacteria-3]